MTDRQGEEIVADLQAVAAELTEATERVEALRLRRESLWVEGRKADPQVTMRALAEASDVSEPLVIRTMTEHRKRQTAAS